jgi:endonuclease-3 related protein
LTDCQKKEGEANTASPSLIKDCNKNFIAVYDTLIAAFGPQNWWPAEGPEEMIIGALLTQNTTWNNVEKALTNLRLKNLLSFSAIQDTPLSEIESLIKPSGYFRQKSQRLKNLAEAIINAGGLQKLATIATAKLREWLLDLHGVGPETADSILLYAFERPIFVIDAYTLRISQRHKWLPENAGYTEAQKMFTQYLPADVPLFNEFHALFVQIGKNFCRPKQQKCNDCPLRAFLRP